MTSFVILVLSCVRQKFHYLSWDVHQRRVAQATCSLLFFFSLLFLSSLLSPYTVLSNLIPLFDVGLTFFPFVFFFSLSCSLMSLLFVSLALFALLSPLLLFWSLIRIAAVRVDVCSDRFGWRTRLLEPCFRQSVAYR